MILGLLPQKGGTPLSKCIECHKIIKYGSKFLYVCHGRNIDQKYCNKCSKMLLRKLLTQLHEDKMIE